MSVLLPKFLPFPMLLHLCLFCVYRGPTVNLYLQLTNGFPPFINFAFLVVMHLNFFLQIIDIPKVDVHLPDLQEEVI